MIDHAHEALDPDTSISSRDDDISPPNRLELGPMSQCTVLGLTSSSMNPDITMDPLE